MYNFNLDGKDGLGSGTGLGSRAPLPPGRITGSASIETLVRVGIEKENGLSPDSKMVIIHDFTPCVDDELQVKRGQVNLPKYHRKKKLENILVNIVKKSSNSSFAKTQFHTFPFQLKF